ncbi:3244_t:CDS:1, partial [Rhizophagus irregularis]
HAQLRQCITRPTLKMTLARLSLRIKEISYNLPAGGIAYDL